MTATRRALTSGLWLATAMALYTPAHAAVGRTAGAAAVSPSGEAQYTVPIFAPPGTAGMTPQLALSYGSHGGDALLGVGWSVAGLSAIYRCDKTWAQDGAPSNVLNDNTDRFCRDAKCRWNWRQHEHPRTTRTARTSTSAAAAKSVAARDLSGSSEYECSA